jgi:Uma2 family endonuclease
MASTGVSKRRPSRESNGPRPTIHDGETIADLLARLGNVPANRVRLHPTPGTATEKDLIRVLDHENRPCELVEGTLVEKPMGFDESELGVHIVILVGSFVRRHKLGIVTGADGPIRFFPGLVRIPDIAFVSWDRLPGRKRPKVPIPHLVPDLVVEVLSKGNTKREIDRKLQEYFEAGVGSVWIVDPK